MLMKVIMPLYIPANISAGLGLQLCALQALCGCASVLGATVGLECLWTPGRHRLVSPVHDGNASPF